MTTLVIAEHDSLSIRPATRHAVGAARLLQKEVHVLVAGSEAREAAGAAARISGVDKVLHADAPHLREATAENVAATALSLLPAAYSHVVMASTPFGKSVLPRIAAGLDAAQVSDVIAIEADDTFVRPIYAGSAFAIIRATDQVKLLTIRTTGFEPAVDGANAPVAPIEAASDTGLARVINRRLFESTRPELRNARIVVSGGRGFGSGENFRLLEQLADRLNAAIGASRAAVDASYAPGDCQVGQTGKIVAPDLYIAIGISGAIQHLAGMKDSKVIVAINKDPDAPIFKVADYGLVGDLFEIVPQFMAELG